MAQRVQLSEFGYLYGQTFRQVTRVKLWIPLLVQAFVMLILALMHLYIFSPIIGPIIRAWTGLFRPELAAAFFHYPAQFIFMPYFFGQAQMLVNIFIEAFLFGIVIDLFLALYHGRKPVFMTSVGTALWRYFQLMLVWFVILGVLYLINTYFFDIVENVFGYSLQAAPRRRVGAEFSLRAITVVVYAACIFILPSIMAGAGSWINRIRRGFAVAFRHPFVAIGLVLIPYLVGFLPSWALSNASTVVDTFSPDLVFFLILISIGLDVILNFFMLGTAVKFYMDQST
jgi:MFS family permease